MRQPVLSKQGTATFCVACSRWTVEHHVTTLQAACWPDKVPICCICTPTPVQKPGIQAQLKPSILLPACRWRSPLCA